MTGSDTDGLKLISFEDNTSLDLSMITAKLHTLSPGGKLLVQHLLDYPFIDTKE